jgi:hypothetical protein
MWEYRRGRIPFLHACGRLGQFLLGTPEALVVFLRILWSFKIAVFLMTWNWQVRALADSGVGVSWIDVSGLSCRWGLKVEISLRKVVDWEMQKCWDLLVFEMEDLEGGNFWRKLEVLRCLPFQKEELLYGVRSQSFRMIGPESALFGITKLTTTQLFGQLGYITY